MLKMNFLILFILLSFNASSSEINASVTNAISVGKFKVGIGSHLNIKSRDSNLAGKSLFLGTSVHPDGSASYQMFLNTKTNKIFFIETSIFGKSNPNFQTVLDPFPQAGGTCTGYAMYDYLMQTNLSGFTGTGELAKEVSTEDGRTTLLVEAINRYYLMMTHRYSIKGIMNGFGKIYGFTCNTLKTDSYEKAKNKILSTLNLGSPVIISFNTGPKMVDSPFPMELYQQPNPEMDGRLWIPRKVGERNSGGHTIVAAAAFSHNNKTYMVMIDSDWSEPRIWDMDDYLNQKTALDEVEFITCK
jgi:hypothetical protein